MVHLNDDNFRMYAAKHYDNPEGLSLKDFENDLLRMRSVQKLFNRYSRQKVINIRLLLNHIIILHNVFGTVASELLFYKTDPKYYPYLKSFLEYLNYLPVLVNGINTNAIVSCDEISRKLNKI